MEIDMDKDLLEKDYFNDKLPEEILGLIFQNIEHRKSLLNCRLICKYWKNTFDNSSIVMKQLTFKAEDWRLFNESTIVDKVKSIYFNDLFMMTEEKKNEWIEFCNRIGSTVEKIKLFCYCDDADVEDIRQQAQLINSLVSSCIKLIEIHLDVVDQFIFDYLPETKYEKIQNLVIDTYGGKDVLVKALLHFPNLLKIEIRDALISEVSTALVEYAKARNGLLKEVILEYSLSQNEEDPQEQLKFLSTCANFGFNIADYPMPCHIGAEALLTYEETEDAPVSEIACQIFQFAVLLFEINPLETTRIGFCKNINDLILIFFRPVAFSELLFLQKLQKLEKLHLEIDDTFDYTDIFNHINLAGQILQFEFPHLTCLLIKEDVFGQDINQFLPSFPIYFPSLKRLYLKNLGIVPNDIFLQLSKLEVLEVMEITGIGEIDGSDCQWTDDKFILQCESQRSVIPGLVPAIAAFKNLTKLKIDSCYKLTDICVVQGIALSHSLKQFTILSYGNRRITEASVNALHGSVLEDGKLTWNA